MTLFDSAPVSDASDSSARPSPPDTAPTRPTEKREHPGQEFLDEIPKREVERKQAEAEHEARLERERKEAAQKAKENR